MAADVGAARDGALHLPLEGGPLRHQRLRRLLVQRVVRVRVLFRSSVCRSAPTPTLSSQVDRMQLTHVALSLTKPVKPVKGGIALVWYCKDNWPHKGAPGTGS